MSESVARQRRPRSNVAQLPETKPLTTTRLSDDLTDRIRHLIVTENIALGARLPAERDLAERFGVSRPIVSQALRSLSLMGLVDIRRGSGAYVLRRPETMVTASMHLMLDLDERSVHDLMQLRLWLETRGVEEAAQRRPKLDGSEVAEIETALNRLRSAAGTSAAWIAADTVFHATIVRCAGNPYLAAVYESVHTAVLEFQFRQWVETETVPAWLRNTGPDEQWALHAPIARAVIDRDVEGARNAVLHHHEVMTQHIDAVLKSLGKELPRPRSNRRHGD